MDLELLRTFLELNRTRNFSRAADALNLTQAAVSSRLKTLESILGVELFERSRREMRLTPEGGRLIRHAEAQLAAWQAACQDVSLKGSRQMVIGGSLRLWDVLLQPWLHDLRRAYPDIAIVAESHSPEHLTRRLVDGTMDVAIMLEPAQLDTLQIREVCVLDFICVSTHPDLTISEALAGDFVYIDWGLSHGLDHRRAFPDAPEAKTRVSHARIALEYIRALGGSAYLPSRMVAGQLASRALHEVAEAPVFRRRAYATYPVRSPRSELVESTLTLLRGAEPPEERAEERT